MIRNLYLGGLAGLMLAGCQAGGPAADVSRLNERAPTAGPVAAPPGAPGGTCWGRDETPAVIETVTEHVLVKPAELAADGTVRTPATYRTETRQQIVQDRRELWFETPCPPQMDEEFIASLQRALKARGLYRGAVTGRMDRATTRALRRFQAPMGMDSGVLSMEAARRLGLVAYPRPEARG
ncbi:peptidoglycan-binding domain-containing protein [Actibacterium sp. MT2.3-13A]|uniref:peptidoglycan-binding domain-containing protein n=1 Tax=Actibacterium sp. MT2.3-13A TaxID=2828332 RepID=UPI001BAA34D3|nr:peptidoglycan-binding domain-containing protein [Actibacterium sp. MT2.3-13A]